MGKVRKVTLALLGGCLVALGVLGGTKVSAITCPEGTLRANEEVTSLAECNLDTEDQPPLMETVTGILNVVVGIIAVMAVIVVIIGGVFFVTSQGDAGKVARARNTILYGVIGLVVALLAFAIVNFVLGAVFGGGSSSGGETGGTGGGGTGGSGTPDASQTVDV